MKKTFVLTAVIGSAVVMAVLIAATIWASRRTSVTTNEAVSVVSSFYLEELADQRAKTITNLINNNFAQMKKTLSIIKDEEIDSQDALRAWIGKVKTLLSLSGFALVDEDNVVYTQYTTYTGGSRHEFLSEAVMKEQVVSTVFLYGSSKQLCLAIPAQGLSIMGKPFKACFVQIDIEEIIDLLGVDDDSGTYFGLYYQNGESLSNTDLGTIVSKQNILTVMSSILSEASYQEFHEQFTNEEGGSLTFNAGGTEETLRYVPIPDTNWVLAVLIRESVIHNQIKGISESNLITGRYQIAVTLLSVLILAVVLLLQLRSMSKEKLEEEKETSRAFRNMANTDSLTGIRNKHSFLEYEASLNQQIQAKEIQDLGVVVCDINGLKHINDTLGHAAGDILIKDACRLICKSFSHSPVFRIGGDEFVVVLQGHDFDTKDAIFSELNHTIEANIKTNGVVISLGFSALEPGDKQLKTAFERADQRMYERKKELKAMGAVTRDS